ALATACCAAVVKAAELVQFVCSNAWNCEVCAEKCPASSYKLNALATSSAAFSSSEPVAGFAGRRLSRTLGSSDAAPAARLESPLTDGNNCTAPTPLGCTLSVTPALETPK